MVSVQRYSRTVGFVNNNPTNIRYSTSNKWQGQTGSKKGFCVFSAQSYAFRATALILFKYIDRGANTLEKMIARWAPETENNTEAYIRFVSKATGIPRKMAISKYNRVFFVGIMTAMSRMECAGYVPDRKTVEIGYDLAVTE